LRQPDRGHDAVLAPREPPQHLGRVGVVARFSQDGAVEQDERVGGEDPIVGMSGGSLRGLFPGKASHGVASRLARLERLVDLGRRHFERNAERGQDLHPARRR